MIRTNLFSKTIDKYSANKVILIWTTPLESRTISTNPFTVSLHSPNDRQINACAIRAVQGDCQWLLQKMAEIPTSPVSPQSIANKGNPQLCLDQPPGPTNPQKSDASPLEAMSDCLIPHWQSYCLWSSLSVEHTCHDRGGTLWGKWSYRH